MRIVGGSMAPTLESGELVWVGRQAAASWAPRRGDLVAARPVSCGGRAVVKRVVALPRERMTWRDRHWELGPEQFFLLGDSPEQSIDSRQFGPVARAELIGPVQARLWPYMPLRGMYSTAECFIKSIGHNMLSVLSKMLFNKRPRP